MKYLHITRAIGIVALLWVIGHHAHWSVTALLAVLALDHELTAYAMRKIAGVVKWPRVG